MKWLSVFLALALLVPAAAQAQRGAPDRTDPPVRQTDDGYRYAPAGCDFTMIFPSEPHNGRRCNPDRPSDCMPQTTYTKSYGLDTAVSFAVTCNPVPPGTLGRYTEDSMQVLLAAMANKNRLDNYETGFQQFSGMAKQAVILGTGRTGDSEKLFMGQIWIGHDSLFTVEGEVIGTVQEEAENLFADILASIQPVNLPPAQTNAATPAAPGGEPAKDDGAAKDENAPKNAKDESAPKDEGTAKDE